MCVVSAVRPIIFPFADYPCSQNTYRQSRIFALGRMWFDWNMGVCSAILGSYVDNMLSCLFFPWHHISAAKFEKHVKNQSAKNNSKKYCRQKCRDYQLYCDIYNPICVWCTKWLWYAIHVIRTGDNILDICQFISCRNKSDFSNFIWLVWNRIRGDGEKPVNYRDCLQ